jgi:hypothetical protein
MFIYAHSAQTMSTISTPDTDVDSRGSSPALSPPSSVSSTPSSSSSDSCQTPEVERIPDVHVVDDTFVDSDPEDVKDGDYLPFEISNSSPPVWRRMCKTMQQPKSEATAEPKMKRKASHTLVRVFFYHVITISHVLLCRSNQTASAKSMAQTSFVGSEAVGMFPRQDLSVSNIEKRISPAAFNAHNRIAERYLFAARR